MRYTYKSNAWVGLRMYVKALISPWAQSTMNAEGFHSGQYFFIRIFKDTIHGVRSAFAHREVRTHAVGMPWCHSSNTMSV